MKCSDQKVQGGHFEPLTGLPDCSVGGCTWSGGGVGGLPSQQFPPRMPPEKGLCSCSSGRGGCWHPVDGFQCLQTQHLCQQVSWWSWHLSHLSSTELCPQTPLECPGWRVQKQAACSSKPPLIPSYLLLVSYSGRRLQHRMWFGGSCVRGKRL